MRLAEALSLAVFIKQFQIWLFLNSNTECNSNCLILILSHEESECFDLFILEKRNYLIELVHLQRIYKIFFLWTQQESSNCRQFVFSHFSAFSKDSSPQRRFYSFFCLKGILLLCLYGILTVSVTLSFPRCFVHRYTHIHLLAPKQFLTLQCLSSLTFQWGINVFVSCSKK